MGIQTSFHPKILLLLGVSFIALTNGQGLALTGLGLALTGLPTLTTDNVVLGATTSSTSAKTTSATSSSATKSSTSTSNAAVTTTSSSISGLLTDAPTLYGVGVPPLIVPDTANAPFMQKSNLPEGFVFICVGAVLAFLGLSVIAWRALVAWSLHRSVKRAASDRYTSEKMSAYGVPSSYSGLYQSENVSLEHLAAKESLNHHSGSNGGTQRLSKAYNKPSKRQSSNPAGSSLFFSPTAGGGQRSNRASTYLPSGYYASGSTTLAGGTGMAHLGGSPAGAYGRVGDMFNDSPPSTRPQSGHAPNRSASRDRLSAFDAVPQNGSRDHQRSRSGLRASTDLLSTPVTGQRAPSAVLDELFDHHTGMR